MIESLIQIFVEFWHVTPLWISDLMQTSFYLFEILRLFIKLASCETNNYLCTILVSPALIRRSLCKKVLSRCILLFLKEILCTVHQRLDYLLIMTHWFQENSGIDEIFELCWSRNPSKGIHNVSFVHQEDSWDWLNWECSCQFRQRINVQLD